MLNLGFVRKIFGLKKDYDQTNTSYIIIASILLGVLFWIVESTLDYLFFYADKSFLDLLVLDVPIQEIYIRTLFFLACLIGGLLAAKILRRKRESDRDLYESEERFRLLVQNMPVLINAFGADDNILFWNRECEKATGYNAREIIGNPNAIKLLYPDPAYRQQVMEEWAERGDDFKNWGMVITCEDGSPRTISWTNISDLFPIPGWKSWAIGVDVTEKKQAEEKLKEYFEHLEEMMEERTKELRDAQERLFRQEKLELLGQMAGGVAHELRNPLGVISNAVYYLQLVIEDADETTREYLDLISSEINSSNKIMNDLLDI